MNMDKLTRRVSVCAVLFAGLFGCGSATESSLQSGEGNPPSGSQNVVTGDSTNTPPANSAVPEGDAGALDAAPQTADAGVTSDAGAGDAAASDAGVTGDAISPTDAAPPCPPGYTCDTTTCGLGLTLSCGAMAMHLLSPITECYCLANTAQACAINRVSCTPDSNGIITCYCDPLLPFPYASGQTYLDEGIPMCIPLVSDPIRDYIPMGSVNYCSPRH